MPGEMRDSNPLTSRRIGRWLALGLVVGLIAAACSSQAPSPSATPSATPVAPTPTPDPHLVAPVSADVIFRAFTGAGLKVVANNAGSGASGEPVRSINATYLGWPLIISEYSSVKALLAATPWKDAELPGQGEPPIALTGLNILVTWGPTTGAIPPTPDDAHLIATRGLIAIMDPLLWPLRARSIVSVTLPDHTPTPSASPSPSLKPTATPKPTKKPKPKPTPKPTKKPKG